MKTPTLAALMIGSVLFAPPVLADEKISIVLTNLTRGFHFTPLLVAAHDDDHYLFRGGEAASAALQAMAEGGEIGGLAILADDARRCRPERRRKRPRPPHPPLPEPGRTADRDRALRVRWPA